MTSYASEWQTEEAYIVRIQRSDDPSTGEVVGVVEEIGIAGNRSFRSLEELSQILTESRVPEVAAAGGGA